MYVHMYIATDVVCVVVITREDRKGVDPVKQSTNCHNTEAKWPRHKHSAISVIQLMSSLAFVYLNTLYCVWNNDQAYGTLITRGEHF